MSILDWTIVALLNGVVAVAGIFMSRGTTSAKEWFLGSRSLAWWTIALSAFATGLDNAEIVSTAGDAFDKGIQILSIYTLGIMAGGCLAAFVVLPPIYQLGFYTNAEYLEARYCRITRLLSALIQIQYRSIVLGMMIWSVYLVLTRLVELHPYAAWMIVVACVLVSGAYTAWGGLRTVVLTDALQSLIVMAGLTTIFLAVWQQVGGWESLVAGLEQNSTANRDLTCLVRIGEYRGASNLTSPYVIVLAWVINACGYWTVNHTQAMRFLGARSVWDMQMAVVWGCVLMIPAGCVCVYVGLGARVLFPDYADKADTIYPHLANTFLGTGFKGLVVAGIMAAAISSFDSIGSALSTVFSRDVYARFLVRKATQQHYFLISRITTLFILVLGFTYVPLLASQNTMLDTFRNLISVSATPLMSIYVWGTATRVHRRSGLVGLCTGVSYGLIALAARQWDWFPFLPHWLTGPWVAFLWAIVATSAGVVVTTILFGLDETDGIRPDRTEYAAGETTVIDQPCESPFADRVPFYAQPSLYGLFFLLVCWLLVFGVFW